jgi:capsid protein
MAWNDFFKNKSDKPSKATGKDAQQSELKKLDPSSFGGNYMPAYPRTQNLVYSAAFDGEKTIGELGNIYDLKPDHLKLRLRAYELDLKTDLVKLITGKFFKWCVGTGLKFEYEPDNEVLQLLGYQQVNEDDINKKERLFNLWAKSKLSDYSGRQNLHAKASDAFKTAFLGGDALIVMRLEKTGIKIQLIDGEQLETPFNDELKGANNKIVEGVEVNPKGEHVAFWVKTDKNNNLADYERLKAKDSRGNLMVWMIYGDKHRVDHHRGIPKISSMMEKISKLDRFVEASVSKAEKMADLVYTFEHDDNSTGENPLGGLGARKISNVTNEDNTFEESGRTAQALRQSTSGQVLNLPRGAKLKSTTNESEVSFDPFHKAIIRSLCASIDIPPEFANQMFEQSYSSSRAAINMWEYIIDIYRESIIVEQFYKPINRFWCYYQYMKGTLDSPGYDKAVATSDEMALEAYYSSRFVGKKMQHIDPFKEAKAIRSLLQDNSPLISREQATQMANGSDWITNYNKYKKENSNIELKPLLEEPRETRNGSVNGNSGANGNDGESLND